MGYLPKIRYKSSMHTIAFFVILFISSFFPLHSQAAVQRMLLPQQSFSISPGGVTSANAFCLDEARSTPSNSDTFSGASATLQDVSVEIEGKTLTLQQAISQKLLAIRGTGTTEELEFISLVSNKDIRINVSKNSVVTPEFGESTSDVSEALKALEAEKELSQDIVWDMRKNIMVSQLGLSTQMASLNADPYGIYSLLRSGNLGYAVELPIMSEYQSIANSKTPQGKPNGFIVLRVGANVDFSGNPTLLDPPGPPQYFLFTGNEPPVAVIGNDALSNVAAVAQKAWKDKGGAPPPVLILSGDSDEHDMDAARLTLEISARSNTASFKVGGNVQSSFSFKVPESLKPRLASLGSIEDGRPWREIEITRANNSFSADMKAGNFIYRFFSKTAEMMAHLIVTADRFLNRYPMAQTAMDATTVEMLRRDIRDSIQRAYYQNRELKKQEDNVVGMEVFMGSQVPKIKIVEYGIPMHFLARNFASIE
ncbi:hypothetical protein [Azospirillum sp. SYSU D00513]|uniref:hypothetical protein n=1 Tax=Azospirillum sp. SYSU D00513 TaxID=2812561 RepID=UPI001A971072|nr:hypothetical protein [Azospirillum sp. SYSU D00513]